MSCSQVPGLSQSRQQKAMDFIHKFLNILLPPLTLLLLCFLLPPYFIFKCLRYVKRSIFEENVAGKVVLITGASSGIGEYLAYEYGKKGARLALVARREDRLNEVAAKASELGSPDVIVICADVSKVEDLDHLVNNAGIIKVSMFEDVNSISDFHSIMDINFWGSLYVTHLAVPHLRKSKGKIVVISSTAGWFPTPRLSFYNASKAAVTSLFDTLRTEFGSDIGITIVTPGLIESEMTKPEFISEARMEFILVESTETCAKAIVSAACRGERYVTEPSWSGVLFVVKLLCPEVVEWFCRLLFINRPMGFKKNA
ncbi:11-beta-hydroxysteroid dehydrogenase A-like isoform X2 [Mangifera indica]|uniref:11-beta-hydroxysteroid dehydrogenase A-like isoform X2 n=1 Tax=Mangifera indica TaxID=29780 RepID=UPI001CFA64A6|nr:11-beta-hydroxysteroid dehydrogenase A-like isoform X2 [Mangifera indica]